MYTALTDAPAAGLRLPPDFESQVDFEPSNLPSFNTLLQRITWALGNAEQMRGDQLSPVPLRIKRAIWRLSNGRSKAVRQETLAAIADYCSVPYGWLGTTTTGRDKLLRGHGTSLVNAYTLWNISYPEISSQSERLEWAYALARKFDRKLITIKGVSAGRYDLSADHESANRLGQTLRVHALWLQGADVNLAKSSMPNTVTAASMKRYLSLLARAGYPFYETFFTHRSHPFGLRFNFAITRFELATGHRVDLVSLARKASCDIGAIQSALQTGRLQVRLAVRLAKYLQISVVWLHTGLGDLSPENGDWQKYFSVMNGAECQGDRMDLALLQNEARGGKLDSWAATVAQLGITPASLSFYRSCLRRISTAHADVLAKALQVDATWLRGSLLVPGLKCSCSTIEHHNGRSAVTPGEDLSTILGRVRHAKAQLNIEHGRTVTWTELADSTGVTVPWFSQYAHGRRRITWHAAQILALGLHVNPHWLWTGEGDFARNQATIGEPIESEQPAASLQRNQMLLQETR